MVPGTGRKDLGRVGRLVPVQATDAVARVLAEEGRDALGAKVSDAVLASPRQDNGAGVDDLMLVDSTLEIGQHKVTTRGLVAEVAEGLHNLASLHRVVGSSAVSIERFIVLYEGLAENLLAGPLSAGVVNEAPHSRDVDLD